MSGSRTLEFDKIVLIQFSECCLKCNYLPASGTGIQFVWWIDEGIFIVTTVKIILIQVLRSSMSMCSMIFQVLIFQGMIFQGMIFQGMIFQDLIFQGMIFQGMIF